MNQFMVEVNLPQALSQEFLSLIPRQREYIDEMFHLGVISGYTLSMDRSKLWVVLTGHSLGDVKDVIDNFPIAGYCDYHVHQLAFHNAATAIVPEISLN